MPRIAFLDLTPREQEILDVSMIFAKIHVDSRAAAVDAARDVGLGTAST